MQTDIKTISRAELEQKLAAQPPTNEDREGGYALVNVLKPKLYQKEHIPNSINIPLGDEAEFEQRFAKDKPIIVYCASADCDASPKAARRLRERGFSEVIDYERGMRDWKTAGNPVVGTAA